MSQKYCISVDWMQVYCKCNYEELPKVMYLDKGRVDVKQLDRVTPLWKEVYQITYMEREIAELCRIPRSSALDKFGCTLKLANRVLYSREWLSLLRELIEKLRLKYVGITRIDLCADCNELAGNRLVESFLLDFFTHAPLSEGHIIRSGSRKLTVQATRDKTGFTRISGMRWGSPNNDVSVYCYNKSLELLEVKDKPWIREVWQENGLINVWSKDQFDELSDKEKQKLIEMGDSYKYVQKPVWRFEISIKGHAKDLLHLDTGELFRLSLDFLDTQEAIKNLFFYYAEKYLDFRINTGQNKLRYYMPLILFEDSPEITMKPINVNLYADTGRTEKIAANLLEKIQRTYSDLAPKTRGSIQYALQFLRMVSGAKEATVRIKKELAELDHIRATRFAQSDVAFYLDFVHYAHAHRAGFEAQEGYNFIKSLIEAVKEDAKIEAMRGFTSDVSPFY